MHENKNTPASPIIKLKNENKNKKEGKEVRTQKTY